MSSKNNSKTGGEKVTSIKAKEKNPPLEEVSGDKGPQGFRAINTERMDRNFIHMTWTEPSDYGDPVGPKGALGVAGSQSAYDTPDPLLLAIDYCKGIEDEYVKLTKRLRSFALTNDTNLNTNDDRICPIMRSGLVNLYNDLGYLYEQLKEMQKHGYGKTRISEKDE